MKRKTFTSSKRNRSYEEGESDKESDKANERFERQIDSNLLKSPSNKNSKEYNQKIDRNSINSLNRKKLIP